MFDKPIRVLLTKLGLDGHDRGIKIVARCLRDAGMEVVYTGLRQSTEMIAEAALEEDVQVVGISIHSGAHNTLIPMVISRLQEYGVSDVAVLVGGIVAEEDVPGLKKLGVHSVHGPGTPTMDIVNSVRLAVADGDYTVRHGSGTSAD